MEYALYNTNTNELITFGKTRKQKIDARSLQPGAYVLRVVYKDKVLNEHILIE